MSTKLQVPQSECPVFRGNEVVRKFILYTGAGATSGHSANLCVLTIGVQGYILQSVSRSLLPLPHLNLGNNVQLQRLSFSAGSSFVPVRLPQRPPFPAQSLKDSPPPAFALPARFGTPGNLIGPSLGLLSQRGRRVSLLLPVLVYNLSHLTLLSPGRHLGGA